MSKRYPLEFREGVVRVARSRSLGTDSLADEARAVGFPMPGPDRVAVVFGGWDHVRDPQVPEDETCEARPPVWDDLGAWDFPARVPNLVWLTTPPNTQPRKARPLSSVR